MAYGPLKALVIDDQAFVRRAVRFMMRNLGFEEIAEAADGADGLETAKIMKPDVVICDIEMQKMDGMAFLEALRAEERRRPGRPAAVIFLTSHAQADLVQQARRLGVDGFLVKPVTAQDLKKRIDQVFARTRGIGRS